MYISPSRFWTRSGTGNIRCHQGHLSPPPFPFPLSFCQDFPADGVSMGSHTVLLQGPWPGQWLLSVTPRAPSAMSSAVLGTQTCWQSREQLMGGAGNFSIFGGHSQELPVTELLRCLGMKQSFCSQWEEQTEPGHPVAPFGAVKDGAAGWKSWLWGLRSTPKWPGRAVGKHTAHVQDTSSSSFLPTGPSSLSLPAPMSWLPNQLFRAIAGPCQWQ